ncbi:MAG: MBL fold metallo-hydrolase [Archaeoglobus sp.]|jgi:L-ascorbate metabolism protein UlaG (beta-lactamase superfamily)|nr:MAG: MBL fold metallo-hydrolase [Archaeoglobus sp.]
MKVRWLGNSCVEISEKFDLLIDPNYTIKPKEVYDIVCITHEHTDHIDVEKLKTIKYEILAAPKATLEEYGLDGKAVKPGDEVNGIKVLESWCWKAKESVSYLYGGVIHPGDSAKFPDVSGVKLAFTACFPDFFQQYVEELKRINPELVVPFHYNYEKENKRKNAEELVELLTDEGLNARVVKPGEIIEI